MLVFYSGQGEWCHICTDSNSDKYLKKTVSIFTDGTGIFQLPKKSEKEIRYDGEAIVCGLLICADHENRATPPQDIQDLEHGKTIFSLDTPKLFKQTDIINTEIEAPQFTQTEIRKPSVIRENDFNACFSQVILDFIDSNGYVPSVESTIERLKHKPPHGYIVSFNNDELSIEGSSPKKIVNVKRSIKRLLANR